MKRLVSACGHLFLLGMLSGCSPEVTSLGVDGEDAGAEEGQATTQAQLVTSTYACETPDPCRGETFEGRCVGQLLIWCEDNVVRTADCKRECGWDGTNQFYNCL